MGTEGKNMSNSNNNNNSNNNSNSNNKCERELEPRSKRQNADAVAEDLEDVQMGAQDCGFGRRASPTHCGRGRHDLLCAER
mmetsp:Transcript_2118/g.3928  ORF Transcript_2118/g.3928 Transcript_2118/m.3928 type:complete len:81 (-) Transcript_2118:577-819(-)